MYSPHVQLGNPDQIFEVGPYSAHLHSKIIPTGMIYYRFLLLVHDQGGQPCLYVTSETDLISGMTGAKAPSTQSLPANFLLASADFLIDCLQDRRPRGLADGRV